MERLPPTIWTIGHSTHTWEGFLGILKGHRIEALADVRLLPGSKRYPHFNRETLAAELARVQIEYRHFAELGGRRKPRPDSPNTAWRNESFRGYADYMDNHEFRQGITALAELARARRTAVMCAEAVWWQCHRALISDWFKVRGVQVMHILSENKAEEHPYTSAATIVEGHLSYRAQDAELPL